MKVIPPMHGLEPSPIQTALPLKPGYQPILAAFGGSQSSQTLIDFVGRSIAPSCQGISGAARLLLALHLQHELQAPVLWVAPSSDSAERLIQDLQVFLRDDAGIWASLFPEREESAGVKAADPVRLSVLEGLNKSSCQIIVTTIRAVLQRTVRAEHLKRGRISLKVNEQVDRETLLELLASEGYQRAPMVERRGEFSMRGGILDIYPITGDPVRLELFGDEIESIRRFDRDTQRSLMDVPEVELLPAEEGEDGDLITQYLPRGTVAVLEEPSQIRLQAMEWSHEGWGGQWGDVLALLTAFRPVYLTSWSSPAWDTVDRDPRYSLDFPVEAQMTFPDRVDGLMKRLPGWLSAGSRVALISNQTTRLREILVEQKISGLVSDKSVSLKPGELIMLPGAISEGFRLAIAENIYFEVLSDHEIMGTIRRRRPTRKAERSSLIHMDELNPGSLVVHLQHGVGRYTGVRSLVVQGHARDFLALEYAKGDGVFVPVEQLDLIQKYQGFDEGLAKLSKMGGQEWTKARAKAREDADKMAEELLRLYAAREMSTGITYPPDSPWQVEMEEAFPWQETVDQLRVIDEVKADMESHRPMDRLVCGDVGYGKTEVALRAAFKAAVEGRQVAVLVPTTVLAHQHYQTFAERLAAFPVKIDMMSRFRTTRENKQTLDRMAEGEVDIVVGTHRLLSKDVKFKQLGLLIIDEEHRFGVRQKERIKEIRASVDVLAMTATPIPRTLNMALSGIRDMSVIETPPEDRVPIKTYLFEHHPDILQGAITRELAREGQVFVIHNRIEGIERLAQDLRRLVPSARIAVGHGQMPEEGLEKVLMTFLAGEYDVLVCTTIVESGVDIPNVNTIVINNAHHFGLAQLYQLRGRVGRSSRQAYCYLLYPPARELTDDAIKRLETIRDFTHLGAGYQIAMRDLEIRGAGDILGSEQSGNIAAVGFELYCKMLNDAVKTLRGEKPAQTVADETPVVLDVPAAACLPDDYVSDSQQKVALYKKIAQVRSHADLEAVREELRDRFGPPPPDALNLLAMMDIRLKAKGLMIPSIRVKDGKLFFLTPFLRPLSLKEHQQLFSFTGWRCTNEPHMLVLAGLFGVAAGPPVYPPGAELLEKILKVLTVLEHVQKTEAAPAPPPPPVRSKFSPRR
jgi:transcription-repair coupling factor (superfamily II helicase)